MSTQLSGSILLNAVNCITARMFFIFPNLCNPTPNILPRQEFSPLLSSWSQTVTQLLRKLEQLHLEIEEALSVVSSPGDTPYVSGVGEQLLLGKDPLVSFLFFHMHAQFGALF